jgi:hypothetical protein
VSETWLGMPASRIRAAIAFTISESPDQVCAVQFWATRSTGSHEELLAALANASEPVSRTVVIRPPKSLHAPAHVDAGG